VTYLAFVGLSLYSVYFVSLFINLFTVSITYLLLLAMVTLTLRPWYQVHTMKTFNKRNEMHKYGAVYLNRGSDLYVAIDMSRMLTNFIGPQACKN